MKIIPSFKPSISYKELRAVLLRILLNEACDQQINMFENRFALYVGVKHAIRVPSARWGLYCILESLGFREGDEIIMPAFTYFAVPAAIVRLGLKPVFVDINPCNLNIDAQKIKDNITERTRAVIPTHLCGFVCGLEEILDIAQKYNIKVIEDCAQSLGAEYKNKKTGAWGDAAYFSFGVTKNFTTLDGAMIVMDNDALADKIRRRLSKVDEAGSFLLLSRWLKACIIKISVSSILFPYIYYLIRVFSFFGIDIINAVFHEKMSAPGDLSGTCLLNGIQAGLGMTQLSDLDGKNNARMKKGLKLYESLKDFENTRTPSLEAGGKNIFSTCPILFKGKKNIKKILLKNGIDVSSGYMRNCARLDIFKEYKKECPNASRAEHEVLYLPMYPELTDSELMYMSEIIKRITGN